MRFHTGKKSHVLHLMAEYAIRDQEQLIDALASAVKTGDESSIQASEHAKRCIEDFRRFLAPRRA